MKLLDVVMINTTEKHGEISSPAEWSSDMCSKQLMDLYMSCGRKKKKKQIATFYSLSVSRVLPTQGTKKGLRGENNLSLCNQGQP